MSSDKKFDVWALFVCLGLALAFRLPGLTVFLTADEARSWFGRSIIFLDSLAQGNWANTAPGGEVAFIENVSLSPAPGVMTMWAGAIGLIVEYLRRGAPGSLSQFLQNIPFDPLDPAMLFYLRLPSVLIAVAAVGLTFWWSRPLLGRWGAFLTAGLFALDPFSLALSRVLGHDGLVSVFMWLSLLAFIRAVVEGRRQKVDSRNSRLLSILNPPSSILLLSGAFAGLACLAKYPALFMGGFIALIMLFIYLWQTPTTESFSKIENLPKACRAKSKIREALPRWISDMLWWIVAAAVVFVLLWPAMWVNPLGPVTTILNDALRASGGSHPKGSFFLGQPVPDPGWLFYPLVALFRTTPVILLGLLLALWQIVSRRIPRPAARSLPVGQVSGSTHQQSINDATSPQENHVSRFTLHASRFTLHASLILLAYVLFYTLLVTYGGKKQDRYLLPIFPALSMLATIGYLYALRTTHYALVRSLPLGRTSPQGAFISAKPPLRTLYALRLTWLAPLIILVIQAAFALPTYPYYFSFYNPLAGGSPAAARLLQVGWGEGLNEAAA
ncbi:MAG: hypothetical protein HYR94_19165, partial [Chloroflexi bacterium]|nr:hypothetical protein [Chloroflexota bacterium]